ncbi:MAG: hypothetical protein K0U34_07595 [Alphaproteobacteria bacterium]|nr:hypothetical protein [Alphaproteobacteria bacterium]
MWFTPLALGLALLVGQVTSVRADEASAVQPVTGSVKQDAVVAPVRRVFPKTPSDRELSRLAKTKDVRVKDASASAAKKSKKR